MDEKPDIYTLPKWAMLNVHEWLKEHPVEPPIWQKGQLHWFARKRALAFLGAGNGLLVKVIYYKTGKEEVLAWPEFLDKMCSSPATCSTLSKRALQIWVEDLWPKVEKRLKQGGGGSD